MLVMLGTCFAKPEDWYDVNDIDGHIAGQQFACGVCNVLVAATTDLLKAKVRCTSPRLVPCVKASIAVSDPGGPDAEVLQYGLRQGTFASLARAHATDATASVVCLWQAQTDTEKRELCHRIVEDAGQDVIDEISLGTPSDEVTCYAVPARVT